MTDEQRPNMRDLVRQHTRPLDDLVVCYRIAYGDEAVDAALEKTRQRVLDKILRPGGSP